MLALLLLVQSFVPVVSRASNDSLNIKQESDLVKVGELDIDSYPKLDNKTILAIQKQARENKKLEKRTKGSGLFSVDSPYLPGQNPTDEEKAAAYGNLNVNFKVFGLKENGTEKEFQWNEIFGTDSNGKPGTADIYFVQRDAETNAEIHRFKLTVNKAGEYKLLDIYGKPANLPLYSTALKPYKYDVELDIGVSEKVMFLTVKLSYSGNKVASFTKDADGNIIADIPLDLQLAQIASTKFVSEWKTDVEESDRPAVNGDFDTLDNQDLRYFPFPKNDTDELKLRMESYNLETDVWPGYDPQTPPHLRVVPKVSVEEDMLEDPATYEIDKDNSRITANGKTYKYDLRYDVINGGKLTMTEIIPLTFDANGGKFASLDATAEQKIVKEVDYEKDLTEDVEKPKKDRETFKAWATEAEGNPLSDEEFNKAITNVKEAKTFYAIWDNNDIVADQLEVKESFKDGTGYVNDFIPKLETLKGQVKIKDASGTPQALTDYDTLQILDDDGNAIADADLKDKLYEKLKEDDATEVSRKVTLKAKVTHKNGTSQEVDIPIKVIKNIYEAKTKEGKPIYVPENYVKVTLDPTTKAKDPQKTYFYVNPQAKVVIPGENPTGTGENLFVKWTYDDNGTETEYKLSKKPRHQFKNPTTITAQYSADVIPQTGEDKPDTVPANFVEVKFVPTDKATDTAEKIYWVNPKKEVTIPVENPVGKQYYTFAGWKIGVNADGDDYTPTVAKQFTDENGTIITATYTESDNIIPYDPKDPKVKPDGYITVSFDADLGLKLKEVKYYFVKKNTKYTSGNALTLKTIKEGKDYGYPKYEKASGYDFDKWDLPDTTEIKDQDIVVTAKAKPVSLPDKPGDNPGYGPSYPEVVYRDRIVEKEKIVEKIVHVDDGMNKEIRYMQGFDGFFRPYDGLSRAEAAQILANALREDGYVYNPNFVLPYSDVGNMWYTEAVKVVTEAGVFKGDGNGLFKPTDKITRAEWIATLRRFQNLQEANGNTMNLKAGHWATNEVQAAYEAGWLDIYQNGIAKFASDEPITRQEVAAVSNKAFRRVLDKIYIDRNYKGLINYKDIDSSMALYEDILCASNTFLHDGKHYRAHGVLYKEIKFDHKTVFNIDTDDLKISQDKFQYILR